MLSPILLGALLVAVFVAGALVPLATVLLAPPARLAEVSSATALATLLVLGGVAARAGGAPVLRGAVRVAFWGALAMALTAGIGRWFGAVV